MNLTRLHQFYPVSASETLSLPRALMNFRRSSFFYSGEFGGANYLELLASEIHAREALRIVKQGPHAPAW
jgi:hypothetical protein